MFRERPGDAKTAGLEEKESLRPERETQGGGCWEASCWELRHRRLLCVPGLARVVAGVP